MEKKKILLIAIITGVFLTAVILFPLVLLSNSKATVTAPPLRNEIPSVAPASADVMGMVTTPEPRSGDTSQNITINNYSPDLNAVESTKTAEGLTINVLPAPIQVAPVESPPQPAPTEKPAENPTKTPVAKPAPKPAEKPTEKSAEKPAVSPKQATSKTPAAKPAPKPQKKPEYWIQTGSFSVKSNAERAKVLLDEKRGLPQSVIENRDVKGESKFRLRVGPFLNKSEAEYWLNLIREMEGFEGSLIFTN